jgi:DNA polymerase-1
LLSRALWDIEPDQVTDTHRREAKPFVFGLLYDDDPYGLAMRVGCAKEKAEQIKEAVFGCYPMLGKWIAERVKETAKTGAAWTWWDGLPARRRPLVEAINLDTPTGKTQRRSSWNTPIQGTGNEYLVASACKVVDWIVSEGVPAKVLVTIHDSMLLEVRDDCVSEVHAKVLEIMCSHRTKNGVPLAADAKVGRNWASMQKWKKGQPCPLEGCT